MAESGIGHAPARRRCHRRRVLAAGAAALPLLNTLPVLGTLPLLAPRRAAAAEAGIVTWLRGHAVAVKGEASRPLHTGAAVDATESLRTMEGSRLRLTLADGSTLAMGEASQIVLSEIRGQDGGAAMVFDLLAGIVRAVLGPDRPDVFAVRGRAAVAAARSTDFVVETAAGRTAVFVETGEVIVDAVYGPGSAMVGAGQGIDVVRGEAMGAAKSWGAPRVADVLARTAVGD